MAKICFITYQYGNNDMCEEAGRVIYTLSCYLEKEGHLITVLLTGGDWSVQKSYITGLCRENNINAVHLCENEIEENVFPKEIPLVTSYKVFRYLEQYQFDYLFFLESGASAFHTIQAKRITGKFLNSTILVGLFGSNRWYREKNQLWSDGSIASLRLNYMEKYCCENADVIVSPNEEIYSWCMQNDIKIVNEKNIIPFYNTKEDLYNDINAMNQWRKLFSKTNLPVDYRMTRLPKVSVCMAYYNHGQYLPSALESLYLNTYPNFEVIVVNDGSTDHNSIKVFEELKKKYSSDKFVFLSKHNEYLGKTRNVAASYSSGDYLIFMDSDNIAKPEMIERMVYSIEYSGMDCLTCHNNIFYGRGLPGYTNNNKEVFSPIGPSLMVGLFENCFGDANFIIKKSVFDKIGGFTTDRLSYEDWQLLVKLSLQGYKQDVIPEVLYLYRVTDNSMVHTANMYKSHKRVLDTYNEVLPIELKGFFTEFAFPMWFNSFTKNSVKETDNSLLSSKLINKVNRILPIGSRRRAISKKILNHLLQ